MTVLHLYHLYEHSFWAQCLVVLVVEADPVVHQIFEKWLKVVDQWLIFRR